MSGERLAIDGGEPVRREMLPYGRQQIDAADVEAVVAALRSGWLTTGPAVEAFESALAAATGAAHAVAVSNGTAALHAAYHAIGVGAGDEVVVPAMTFAATATAVLHCGGTPVICDVTADTLLIDPAAAEAAITPRTKAICAVDYAGQPADHAALRQVCARHGIALISDACHALGATSGDRRVGSLADASTFSFHPVKPVTTAEGGAITTDDGELAGRMRQFRNHGITRDHRSRAAGATWEYDVAEAGYNYRLSDVQAALGTAQLARLDAWTTRRRELAARYHAALRDVPAAAPLAVRAGVQPAWHLMMIQLDLASLRVDRAHVFRALRAEGIGVNVHYIPLHQLALYRSRADCVRTALPVADAAYERLLTLPLFPAMRDADVDDVVAALAKVLSAYAR
ncbi:MAG: UDP-4-amino-4,6-dideoxy-N-acetyl-beta-L-altrosamine transaminase [Planctomycetota bacterium]